MQTRREKRFHKSKKGDKDVQKSLWNYSCSIFDILLSLLQFPDAWFMCQINNENLQAVCGECEKKRVARGNNSVQNWNSYDVMQPMCFSTLWYVEIEIVLYFYISMSIQFLLYLTYFAAFFYIWIFLCNFFSLHGDEKKFNFKSLLMLCYIDFS